MSQSLAVRHPVATILTGVAIVVAYALTIVAIALGVVA